MDFLKKKNSTNLLQQSAIYIYLVYPAFIYRIISLMERLLVKRITTRNRVDHTLIIFIVFSAGNTSKEEEGKAKETWQKVSWNVSLCLCYYACVLPDVKARTLELKFSHRWPLLICSHRVCEWRANMFIELSSQILLCNIIIRILIYHKEKLHKA